MASKAFPWALMAVLAAPLTGCDSKPSGDAAAVKAGAPQPLQPAPTATAKEKAKKGAGLKSAVD